METYPKLKIRVTGELIKQIFQEEQSKFVKSTGSIEKTSEVFPQFYEVQSTLFKRRNKVIPPIPDTIEKIEISGDWALCEDGTRLLLSHDKTIINNKKHHIIIFCESKLVIYLASITFILK